MRRLRAGFVPPLPGGAGAPPGDTTVPCQELADGWPLQPPEARGSAAQKGPVPESRRRNERPPKARPGAENRKNAAGGAPRGARAPARSAARCRRPRLSARHSPCFAGEKETAAHPAPFKEHGRWRAPAVRTITEGKRNRTTSPVVPAQAGTRSEDCWHFDFLPWVPAFAGTNGESQSSGYPHPGPPRLAFAAQISRLVQ